MAQNIEHKAIENPENVCFNCLKETEETNLNKIYFPEMGYGGGFDGWSTRINLCEDCMKLTNSDWWKLKEKPLKESGVWSDFYEYEYEDEIFKFVNQMPLLGQELFWNRYSTDNYQMESQDWIDYELKILPHEKCKEYGCYSHQEIEAYETRFPICQHPANRIWKDGSKGCWCPFGASGEYGQKCGLNISDKCYQCKYFTERTTPIKDINAKDYKDYEVYYKAKLNQDKYKNRFE